MARKKQPIKAQADAAHVTDTIGVLMEQLQSALVAASGAAVEDRVAR